MQSALRKSSGRGGFEWVSLRRFAQNDFGARDLLRQPQYQTRLPVHIPVSKLTWDSNSVEILEVKPHGRD